MYKVMIVDDEPLVHKGLAELIDWQALDMGIAACASGAAEALSLMRRAPVQILITDICMPGMDGLELITEARALDPRLRCIVISAHDEFEYVRLALKLGVENYLLKPINSSELTETLTKAVENIERAAIASQASAETVAFRNNILDRWANGSIQDFELAERAALLQIDLGAREYKLLVSVPASPCSFSERLAGSAAALEPLRQRLAEEGFAAEPFIDRHANLAAVLRGDDLSSRREALKASLDRARGAARGRFVSAGQTVSSAYSAGSSYKSAYALLPCRYLEPGAAFASCDDYPVAEATASAAMLKFEQALDAYNADDAMSAVRKHMQDRPQKNFAAALSRLLPFELKLLALFDDSMCLGSPVPEPLARQLRALPSSADAAALLEGLAEAVKAAVQALKTRRNALHPIVNRSIALIESGYGKGINLKAVADQFSLHPAYFGQLFKEETGRLFNDYLTSVRLKKARALLAGTEMKIGGVCAAVGVAQQNYFNRLFKKEYGVTPAEYRRAVRK